MTTATGSECHADDRVAVPYTWSCALRVWLLAAVPLAILSWLLVPLLARLSGAPQVKVFWLCLPLSAACQAWMVADGIKRETGNWNWEITRKRLRLLPPRRRWPAAMWGLAFAAAGLVSLLAPVVLGMGLIGGPAGAGIALPILRLRTMSFFELMSPAFAGQWLWLPVILLSWTISMLAEECLFRGLLLPRMRGGFQNGLLYAVYSAASPWTWPLRMLTAPMIVRPARKEGSTWMSVYIRGLEGLVVAGLLLAGIGLRPLPTVAVVGERYIARDAPPDRFPRGKLARIPAPNFAETYDLRSFDASALDLRGAVAAMSSFDDRTAWPPAERLPDGFDHSRILELGKDPGLGVRGLHRSGVTGRGVGVGIVDRVLLTSHEEIRDRVRWYEELDTKPNDRASMHAAAVASIAVGRTIGVAPAADLYFIGTGDNMAGVARLLPMLAHGLRRLIAVNAALPAGRKIRVASISRGWTPGLPGYDDIRSAVSEAKAAGIFVVSSSLAEDYGFRYNGMGRPELADPERFESYTPGLFWAAAFSIGRMRGRVLIPMDSRTTASPTGQTEYVFYREGGWSWVAPYIAGLYALAAECDPAVTPKRFWKAVLDHGRWTSYQGQPFGPIIDPVAVVRDFQH